MTPRPTPPPSPLRLERVLALLPEVGELRPLLGLLLPASVPDPDRRWSGSGELGGAADRVIDPEALARELSVHAEKEAVRLATLMERVASIVRSVADGSHSKAVEELMRQARDEEEGNRLEEAEAWYTAAYELAREVDPARAPEALRKAARAARGRGLLEEACLRYEGAARSAADAGSTEDEVIARIGRGNVAVDRGRWDEAERWYLDALARIGEGGEPNRARWQLFQNLSIVDRERGRLGEAERWLVRARREAQELGDDTATLDVENGFGQLRMAEGNARAAELHFRAALEGTGAPLARIGVLVNLGDALLANGRALEAGEVARQAEAEALSLGVPARLPEIFRLLARVSGMREEPEAFVFLERALELIRVEGLPRYEEALTLELYGAMRRKEGETSISADAIEKAARIYDELAMGERASAARAGLPAPPGTGEAR